MELLNPSSSNAMAGSLVLDAGPQICTVILFSRSRILLQSDNSKLKEYTKTKLTNSRKLSQLESQMEALRNRVPDASTAVALLELQSQSQNAAGSPNYAHFQQTRGNTFGSPVSGSIASHPSQTMPEVFSQPFMESPRTYGMSLKRKRGDFELNIEERIDVMSKGLIGEEEAGTYFRAFFQGCVSFLVEWWWKLANFAG